MRAMRMLVPMAALLVLALGGPLPAGAGGPNPNWVNTPDQGPSPNTDHVVGSLEGGACVEPVPFPGTVTVELKQQDDTPFTPAVTQTYTTDAGGSWSGLFAIPAGLEPGQYPLEATCNAGTVMFDYTERSYTVIAQTRPRDPEDVEPSLTG